MEQLGGDVTPGSVWGSVGFGHRAHLGPLRAPAAGADPAAVEPPLEPDPGQREQPAAAERLHGMATGRRDVPLALPGERVLRSNVQTLVFTVVNEPLTGRLQGRLTDHIID